MTYRYDSTQLIQPAAIASGYRSRIGVRISQNTFPNHQGLDGVEAVEVESESPTFWSSCGGTYIPVSQIDSYIERSTIRIIGRIDQCIVELQRHRDRLMAELPEDKRPPATDTDSILNELKERIADHQEALHDGRDRREWSEEEWGKHDGLNDAMGIASNMQHELIHGFYQEKTHA